MAGNLRICFSFLFVWLALARSLTAQVQTNDFEAKAAALWKELPAPQVHFEEGTEAEALRRQRGAGEYQAFLQEKLQGQWFAALISAQPDNASSIQARFESWKSLLDFLLEREALVEAPRTTKLPTTRQPLSQPCRPLCSRLRPKPIRLRSPSLLG